MWRRGLELCRVLDVGVLGGMFGGLLGVARVWFVVGWQVVFGMKLL